MRFGGFKIHRAAHAAPFEQRLVHLMQMEQVRHQRLALRRFRATRVGQNGGHFGVGKTRLAKHHRREKLVGVNLALGVDQHVADHAEPLDIRVQRAQAVGELFRQHRNHPARKIHAGGAVVSVDVDGAAGFHVMAHVGNRDQKTPTLAAPDLGRFAVHGVVKVAGVFAIDGDQRDVGQIDAAQLVGWAHRVGQRARQRQCLVAEFVRYAVFAHRDFNFHAGVVDFTQHFSHAADRLAKQRRRRGQLHHHDLASFGSADGALVGNQDILTVAFVFRRDQPDAAFLQQAANDGVGGALDDFRHAAFGAVFAVMAHDAYLDAVFVQHGAHFVGRQIHIGLAIVAHDKAVTIAVAGNSALEFSEESGRSAGGGVSRFDKKSLSLDAAGKPLSGRGLLIREG